MREMINKYKDQTVELTHDDYSEVLTGYTTSTVLEVKYDIEIKTKLLGTGGLRTVSRIISNVEVDLYLHSVKKGELTECLPAYVIDHIKCCIEEKEKDEKEKEQERKDEKEYYER